MPSINFSRLAGKVMVVVGDVVTLRIEQIENIDGEPQLPAPRNATPRLTKVVSPASALPSSVSGTCPKWRNLTVAKTL